MDVGYSRLYSLGNFENEKIECMDVVGPDETYETAYQRVRGIVEAQHVSTLVQRSLGQHERDELYRLRNDVMDMERRAKEVEGRWRSAAKYYDQLRYLLNRHGVELPNLDEYQRPPRPEPDRGGPMIENIDLLDEYQRPPRPEPEPVEEQCCPHCGAAILGASAWTGPEPECEPGILCPSCHEFIADE